MAKIDFLAGLLTGQRIMAQVVRGAVATATQYLYGTPSESGNIGLRSGDTVTYYDGAVLPMLPEWDREKYPYAHVVYYGMDNWIAQAGLYVTSKPMVYYPNEYYCLHADDMGTFDYILHSGNPRNFDGSWDFEWAYNRTTVGADYTSSTACWAIYDIYNEDGYLYLAKSDPIPVTGLVGYSYNGTVLPNISVVYTDELKEEYPCAYIYKGTLFTGGISYYLHLTTADPYYGVSDSEKWCIGRRAGDKSYWWYDGLSDNFEFHYDWTNEGVMANMDNLVWANFDVLDEDGSVYMAASDPIPVYE